MVSIWFVFFAVFATAVAMLLLLRFGPPDEFPTPSSARIRQLRSMPYDEYLFTPEWKHRRQTMLKRFGNRCQLCNNPPVPGFPLHVHHPHI